MGHLWLEFRPNPFSGYWRSGFAPCVHHERTTLSQVNPEHCRLVSLKNRRHKFGGLHVLGGGFLSGVPGWNLEAFQLSMDFALSQKEPFLLIWNR